MKRFQNVLFVVQGHEIEDHALHRALAVLKSTGADITFLVLHPDLSDDLKTIQDAYEKGIEASIHEKLAGHDISQNVKVVFDTATPHFVTIIQHVLKKEYDLVIKAAETLDGKQDRGFKSLDMSLLRKCPCPVWLCRQSSSSDSPKILTAIDPFSESPEGHDLSIKLLEIGQSLAQNLGGSNTVISCWDFEYEGFLRNAPFAKMEGTKVDALVLEAEQDHKDAIDKIIAKASTSTSDIVCQRGQAFDIIPAYVEQQNIDMVVMGTVARTGIPGFIIGNTAENILNNLACEMFAVKPGGFVSPVKAY